MKKYIFTALATLVVAVPLTVLFTRTTADNRGIILNVDQEGPQHVKQYLSLLRHLNMINATDTTNGALYLFLDKTDLMKAFNEHHSNQTKRDSVVGFVIHFGYYGDTLKPAQGKLIPYIRPLVNDANGKRIFLNEEAYEYLPNGCPSRCDIGLPASLFGKTPSTK